VNKVWLMAAAATIFPWMALTPRETQDVLKAAPEAPSCRWMDWQPPDGHYQHCEESAACLRENGGPVG
jgi:hypothetical protein